jgi:hypothetical protein
MDWQDERYVRIFTRDTPDWVSWPWQARALLPLLLRKVDRVGQLALGRSGVRGLAACVGIPEEVCRVGLDALVQDGAVELQGPVVWVRNFQPAQEASMSGQARLKEHRKRKRGKLLESGHQVKRVETGRNEMKRVETGRNEMKLLPSVPSVPSVPKDSQPCEATASPVGDAELVFAYWRETLRPNARVFDAKTRKAVEARLKEFSRDELKLAIDGCRASPHHMGANDKAKRYDSLELICRDGGKVQAFHGYLEAAQKKITTSNVNSMLPPRPPEPERMSDDELRRLFTKNA